MQAKLTQVYVQSVKPGEKLLRIRDTLLKGLVLFVNAGGKKTYYVDYKRPNGKRADHKIGDATLYTLAEARDLARDFLAAVARGNDPTAPRETLTFGDFIKDIYTPWVLENRKSGRATVDMIGANFKFLLPLPLESITVAQIEQWRSKRKKKDGVKSSSLNRITAALNSSINWAVKRNIIEHNPIAKLERLSERDTVSKVRYLAEDERIRLMAALDEREKAIKEARNSHNQWLRDRGMEPLPSLDRLPFVDYLKPLIVLSLSTGIRRNSLLSLEWGDVNFSERTLLVRAATSKSEKQYYVPLNKLAFDTLTQWKAQSRKISSGSLVFPSPKDGKKMDNCNSSWETLLKKAEIENFRWHDMRHDFASQLVMKGVDLNTVRELLGHADLKMTLRYAHLAPDVKMRAVELL